MSDVPILYRVPAFDAFEEFNAFAKSISSTNCKTCQPCGSNPCRGAGPTRAPRLVFPTTSLVLVTALLQRERSLEVHRGLQPFLDLTQKLRRQSANPFGHLGPVQRG